MKLSSFDSRGELLNYLVLTFAGTQVYSWSWSDIIYMTLGIPSSSHILLTADNSKQWVERYYLPTPPLGQDMTQGQFLSGV